MSALREWTFATATTRPPAPRLRVSQRAATVRMHPGSVPRQRRLVPRSERTCPSPVLGVLGRRTRRRRFNGRRREAGIIEEAHDVSAAVEALVGTGGRDA